MPRPHSGQDNDPVRFYVTQRLEKIPNPEPGRVPDVRVSLRLEP